MNDQIVPVGNSEPEEQPIRTLVQPVKRAPLQNPIEEQISFVEVWRILSKRRWVVATLGCTVLGLGMLYTFWATPKYLSTSTLEFNKVNSDTLTLDNPQSVLGDASSADYYVTQQTQIADLQSDTLALQVVAKLGLENRPEFSRKQSLSDYWRRYPDESNLPLASAPHRRANVLKSFHKNLRVQPVSGTRMISIQFFDPDPEVSAAIVNTLVGDYMEQYYQIRVSATEQASVLLSKQLTELKDHVEDSQQKLADFQKQAGILGTDETHNIIMTRLETVDKELMTAQANRIVAQAVWQLAKTGNPELISSLVGVASTRDGGSGSMPDSLNLIENLRAQQSQLKSQYAEAAAKYGSAYPKLLQIQNQMTEVDANIQNEVANLASRAQNDFQAATQTENALRASFEQEKQRANELNDSAVQYTILKHEVDTSRGLYDELQAKLKEAGILAGLRSTNIVLVDPARASDRPAQPVLWMNGALSLFGGLLFGVAGAFMADTFDQTISTPDEAEEISMVPSIGLVPRWKALSKKKRAGQSTGLGLQNSTAGVFVVSHPQSQIAEAYRAIRTSIMQVTRRGQSTVLMVTSPLPSEGKTTTSLNIAGAIAQQGARVLLVEADMRRSNLKTQLNLKTTGGLSSLISMEPCEDLPVRLPSLPKLSVIPAGPATACPAELLGSPRMPDLIQQWRKEYDYIIIDTPPMLSVTDAAVVSPYCDAVVLVIRSGVTTKQSLLRVKTLFQRTRTRVAGVIVNSFNMNSVEHRYYFGYESSAENARGYYTPNSN